MALKMSKSKAFPNRNDLITLAALAGINHAAKIIDFLADNISDYITTVNSGGAVIK